jgi:hypothetical protein
MPNGVPMRNVSPRKRRGRGFFAIGAGNMMAGFAGGFSDRLPPATLFGSLFAITTVMALTLVTLTPRIKRMMGGVH